MRHQLSQHLIRLFGASALAVGLLAAAPSAAEQKSSATPGGFDIAAVPPTKGAAWSHGEGRVNGVDVPLFAYSGAVEADALFKELEASCRDKCTVTREATDLSEVFVIADVASDLCPKCRPLNATTASTLFDDAWAVSVIRASGGPTVVLASPVGPLIARLRLAPAAAPRLKFEGKAATGLASTFNLASQATYKFASTRVHIASGSIQQDLDNSYSRVAEALGADGYGRIEGDAPRAEGDVPGIGRAKSTRRRGTWVKGHSAVQVQVDGAQGNPNAMVVIHEVEAE